MAAAITNSAPGYRTEPLQGSARTELRVHPLNPCIQLPLCAANALLTPGSCASRRRRLNDQGFTLAEVMVTLIVVGITLTLILQGLNTAKMIAADTHNRKVARELALYTLGEMEAGLFWEDLEFGDDLLSGSYAEQGYEFFSWVITLGDENFPEYEDSESGYHDTYAYRRYLEDEEEDDDFDEDEESSEPYERVSIRVTFPKLSELENEITLERWIPWDQVYGVDEDAAAEEGLEE